MTSAPGAAKGAARLAAETLNALYGTEDRFMRRIIALARAYGWLVYHGWTSRFSEAGFPDLVLLRPPRLVFAELKLEGRGLSPAQERWLAALARVPGIEQHHWSPSAWPLIERTLELDAKRQRRVDNV